VPPHPPRLHHHRPLSSGIVANPTRALKHTTLTDQRRAPNGSYQTCLTALRPPLLSATHKQYPLLPIAMPRCAPHACAERTSCSGWSAPRESTSHLRGTQPHPRTPPWIWAPQRSGQSPEPSPQTVAAAAQGGHRRHAGVGRHANKTQANSKHSCNVCVCMCVCGGAQWGPTTVLMQTPRRCCLRYCCRPPCLPMPT
jgi:hypothetical protein